MSIYLNAGHKIASNSGAGTQTTEGGTLKGRTINKAFVGYFVCAAICITGLGLFIAGGLIAAKHYNITKLSVFLMLPGGILTIASLAGMIITAFKVSCKESEEQEEKQKLHLTKWQNQRLYNTM